MKVLRTLGVAFLLAGALCIAVQSGAFDGVAADRAVSIDTVEPQNALLGLDDSVYGGGTVSNYYCFTFLGEEYCYEYQQPQEILRIDNNIREEVTVTDVEVASVTGANDATLEVRSQPDTLAPGDSGGVEVGCSGDVSAGGTADVTLRATAEGNNVTVETAAVTVEDVNYDCREIQ